LRLRRVAAPASALAWIGSRGSDHAIAHAHRRTRIAHAHQRTRIGARASAHAHRRTRIGARASAHALT
jgi:hypothetical protein